jgi:hypothetical protein
MKHQLQLGTESGIVSNEAIKQLMLITDLARTVQTLDASAGTNADDLEFAKLLATGRRNLMVTIATLCQSAFKFDPASASNFDPFGRRVLAVTLAPSELVGVAETVRARAA